MTLGAVAVLAGLCAGFTTAAAQAGVVRQTANLRTGPSIAYSIIRQLHADDEVTLLEPIKTTGYYPVRTAAGTEGWVYGNFVRVFPEGAGATSTNHPDSIYRGCPPEGTAVQQFRRASNRLKNRVTIPTSQDIDSTITLAALLARGDDRNRWQSTQAASVSGIVLDVKGGSEETVNCGATRRPYQDTHIEIGLNPGDPDTSRIIVEVSPRWRAFMAKQGIRWWATDSLRERLKGRRVTVSGWMFFDFEHADEAENTNPKAPGNWRATAWEIHPVTQIQVP